MTNARILTGDCLEQLRTLPDASVQCCVTSPPYFGLRDYGTGQWEGGDTDCAHIEKTQGQCSPEDLARRAAKYGTGQGAGSKVNPIQYRDACRKCGAVRIDQQIGLEATPTEFVARLVDVFREVRRVLKDDGVAWVNMGDSYGSTGGDPYSGFNSRYFGKDWSGKQDETAGAYPAAAERNTGLRPKNLLGVPWRLAFALQADGWFLRQDVIWHKPNPMPESVTDRCTKAHEYVFLLSKSERYFYDAESVSEKATWTGSNAGPPRKGAGSDKMLARANFHKLEPVERRNRRSVWTITSEPYPEAHFATFPTELPRLCILAGSRVGDTILDPFNGSGTTGAVALELARNYIGCELNPDYVALTNRRLSGVTLGLPFEAAA